IYEKVVENLMALPGIYGRKTEKEKFAGAVFSEKLHYYIPGGKIIEGPCFHHDGQNFAKAYDIKYLNKQGKEEYVWQNTFAISTRMLGTMFAVHSDNKGLVIPPKIAENKIVIIPILFEKTKSEVLKQAQQLKQQLAAFLPILDSREGLSPGWKYNEWELAGIPLRIEIGPEDIKKKQVVVVKRNDSKKLHIKIKNLKKQVPNLLEQMQKELYQKAEKILKENTKKTDNKKKLIKLIKDKKMVIIPMCRLTECEEILKADTRGAKALFIDSKKTSVKNKKCIICNKQADYWVYAGKSY
ncbi:MAG: His/Gly/Thr/Pro-type tRNA ligase C-terminal domain-containing protein, partial [Candidatus Nanoarchaeia archaeon]